jgi:Ase1/PRC1/MAP65 family protein
MGRSTPLSSAAMDASYLSQQVNSIIGQLHGLFDEIGVPNHDREAREAEVHLSTSLFHTVSMLTADVTAIRVVVGDVT